MKKIFIFIVFIICALPASLMIFLGESSPGANEPITPKPVFFREGVLNKNVLSDFTDYVGKRFAFRQELITVNSMFYAKIFGISQVEDVILGKDNWFFYSKTLDDYLHKNVISDEYTEKISETLFQTQKYCTENGIEFLFVVAPNKNSIYPQYMPYFGETKSSETNKEKLFKKLDEKNVNYVNLFATLSSNALPLYHKHDTHWNNMGAAIASDAILKSLNHDSDFASNDYVLNNNFDGDLYKMLYPKGNSKDENFDFTEKFTFTYDEPLKNTEQLVIKTSNNEKTGSVLIFRDSFGNALYPFIAESYKQAVFIRKTPYSVENIKEYNIDTLIIEMAERNIAQFDRFMK